MSWSYDPSQLDERGKDAVRFLVKDTDTTAQLVQDEEIAFALSEEGSLYAAAAAICRVIALVFSRRVSLINKESGLKDDMKERADSYLKMADEYDGRDERSGLTVFAGGISAGDKAARAGDADATPPAFRRDLHQTPALSTLSGVLTN